MRKNLLKIPRNDRLKFGEICERNDRISNFRFRIPGNFEFSNFCSNLILPNANPDPIQILKFELPVTTAQQKSESDRDYRESRFANIYVRTSVRLSSVRFGLARQVYFPSSSSSSSLLISFGSIELSSMPQSTSTKHVGLSNVEC